MVGVERRAFEAMQMPRLNGYGALPLVPPLSPHERSVERSELLTFTSLSPKDVDLARQVPLSPVKQVLLALSDRVHHPLYFFVHHDSDVSLFLFLCASCNVL
jgi:hypothetical protein